MKRFAHLTKYRSRPSGNEENVPLPLALLSACFLEPIKSGTTALGSVLCPSPSGTPASVAAQTRFGRVDWCALALYVAMGSQRPRAQRWKKHQGKKGLDGAESKLGPA